MEQDSATGTPAAELTEQLLRADPAVDGAALDAALAELGERVLLPVHPWEFEHMRADATVAELLDEGLIVDLGALGSEVASTASMRTVYRTDWPWQLTFALHAHSATRCACRRSPSSSTPSSLPACSSTAQPADELAPEITLLQDPAYLAIVHGGVPVPGLSVQLRENRWGAGSDADVSAVEVLIQDHPFGGDSRLAQIVARLAESSDRPAEEVAREWFARYADVAIVPLLRLHDGLGWPSRPISRTRCSSSRAAGPRTWSCATPTARCRTRPRTTTSSPPAPASGRGRSSTMRSASSTRSASPASSRRSCCSATSRRCWSASAAAGRRVGHLLDRLLSDATWPCRAKLRTRLHNDIDRYVQIPNPLHGVPTEAGQSGIRARAGARRRTWLGSSHEANGDPSPSWRARRSPARRRVSSAAAASIHPGVQTFTGGAQCTANFIFRDASSTYIGQAAHCSGTGGSASTNGCTTGSLPLGTP